MNSFLGVDTSNYTTSAAICSDDEIKQAKKLLPVKVGECGLRQSDAVFHHTQQITQILEQLLPCNNISAVGVSAFPRRAVGSYMPCFTVGKSIAGAIALYANIPLYTFSHQEGHIAAALYSANKLDLLGKRFIAFHVSGGTTEAILVDNKDSNMLNCEIIGKTLDLNAGQAIDRTGVMLGLNFPCGIELEKLALSYNNKVTGISPCIKGNDISLSGVENKCKKMLSDCEPKEKIARFCIEYILKSLDKQTEQLLKEYGSLPVVYAGGVMSNSIIRDYFSKKYGAFFAEPAFSCDNAAGIAVLTKLRFGGLNVSDEYNNCQRT